MPLIEWVSNIVPVNKKHGMIRVWIDFPDLNRACPKDNFLTPYINQIIDNCARSTIFSFMEVFSGCNQIAILSSDQHKMTFIFSWGDFPIRSYLLS